MKNIIVNFRLVLLLIIAAPATMILFPSCEKEKKEQTIVNVNPDLAALNARFDALESLINTTHQADLNAINDLKSDVQALLNTADLTYADVQMLKTMVQTLTGIALAIQGDVADTKAFVVQIKDLALLMYAAIQQQGTDIDGIETQLAQIENQLSIIYGKLLIIEAQGGNVQQDLSDIENALGGIENVVNLLLNNLDDFQDDALALLIELKAMVQGNTILLNNIDNQIGLVIGNQILLLQGQANGNAAAAAFYAQTTATLQQQGINLQQILTNQAAFQAMYTSDHAAAVALWGQMIATQQAQGGQLNSLQASAATIIQQNIDHKAVSDEILSQLIAQGLNGSAMFAIVQGIPAQISALGTNVQASLNAWGQSILGSLGDLGLSVNQLGTLSGQIWGVVQGIPGFQNQMLQAIADLNLSIADLKTFIQAEIASVKAQISQVQTSIAVLQATTDGIALQILTLSNDQQAGFSNIISLLGDLADNCCCSSCNNNQPASVITTINNTYTYLSNEVTNITDNSVNLTFSQVYNAVQNGMGVANNGGFNGVTGCQIMMPIVNVIQNAGGNYSSTNNYNWTNGSGSMQNQANQYIVNNNCQ